jgi:hypothetical protein
MVPGTSANIGMFDTVALIYSNSVAISGGDKFRGATLLPSGQIVFTPFGVTNVCVLDTFISAPQEFCTSPYFNKF